MNIDYKFKLGLPEEDLPGLPHSRGGVDLGFTSQRGRSRRVPA